MDPLLTHLRYTPKEAAQLLRICRTTLDRLIKRGEIRATRTGRCVFIHRDEIERYAKGDSGPQKVRKVS